jgi:LPXTG-site transpeptidase (sortase) family protein
MKLRKTIIFCSMAACYIIAMFTLAYLIHSSLQPKLTQTRGRKEVALVGSAKQQHKAKYGKPVRLVVADRDIDIAVGEGHYDPESDTWTEDESRALFALTTSLPNDRSGLTYIYGHGTDRVFGRLGTDPPPKGTEAKVYTSNNLVFLYQLVSVRNVKPDDTSILQKISEGKPRLVLQTCTGLFSEWRTVFNFAYKGVTSLKSN